MQFKDKSMRFQYDMGLGWTSRVFKMKSYGHS